MKGSSYIKIRINNPELADICDAGNTRFEIEGDEVLLDLDLGETWLDDDSIPRGGDFVDWFLNLSKELGLIDKKTHDRIIESRKKIEAAIISSDSIYETYDSTNYSFNCHWEEIRTKDSTTVKGFDTNSWDKIWETVDHSEIAKLAGNKGDIERFAPAEYPYWLFLSEGWANPSAKNQFVRKMMDEYGTRTISKDMTFENPEYEFFKERQISPYEMELNGKTIGLEEVYMLPADDKENDYYGDAGTALDVATDVVEKHYRGTVNKSVNSKTDYVVVSNRMRSRGTNDPAKEAEEYDYYCENQKRIKGNIIKGDEKRLNAKKKKPAIQIVFEDDFYKWLHDQYDTLKETHDYFKPYAVLLIRLEPFGSRGWGNWKFKSEHLSQITQESFERFIDESNSMTELVSIIEDNTCKGCFAMCDIDQYENMMDYSKNDTFKSYEKVFINYEATNGNKYQIVVKRDPVTREIQYLNSVKR